MSLVDIVILGSVLSAVGVVWAVVMRSQVRYLRRQAEGRDDEERDRLLRDFLKYGGGN